MYVVCKKTKINIKAMKRLKEIIAFFSLTKRLKKLMVDVSETMDLKNASEVFATYMCKSNEFRIKAFEGFTKEFCAIQYAFMDGYIKALRDNGFEFRNGLVRERNIINDMSVGMYEHYCEDAVKDTKAQAVETLRRVLGKYETSKENINVITNDFEKELQKIGDEQKRRGYED